MNGTQGQSRRRLKRSAWILLFTVIGLPMVLIAVLYQPVTRQLRIAREMNKDYGIGRALIYGYQGDYTSLLGEFEDVRDRSAAETFIRSLQSRYGEFHSSTVAGPPAGPNARTVPFQLHFEHATVNARVVVVDQVDMASRTGDLRYLGQWKLRSVQVSDSTSGDLFFPPQAN